MFVNNLVERPEVTFRHKRPENLGLHLEIA